MGGIGFLTTVADPWAETWVDDKMVSDEANLRRFKLSAEKHRLKFANPGLKAVVETKVEITAEREVRVDVNMKTKDVRVAP